jgi:hypothetical protein
MTSQPSSDREGRMVVMAWMVVMALPGPREVAALRTWYEGTQLQEPTRV